MNHLKSDLQNQNVPQVFSDLNYCLQNLSRLCDFLEKYDVFFERVNKKFSINIVGCNSAKVNLREIRTRLQQITTFVSQKKFDFADTIYEETMEYYKRFIENLAEISIIPYQIDFSKLDNRDWRTIGLAGIHYRSKVFLSYPFRDDDPKKDENQILIDYCIKPLLNLLNIEAVTARGNLKAQDLIDNDIINLVKECDGIMGFYTKGDDIANVDHELSNNDNIIAICLEEGANTPSMRLSRLMINFNRTTGIGDLLLGLTESLKNKKMFSLRI